MYLAAIKGVVEMSSVSQTLNKNTLDKLREDN